MAEFKTKFESLSQEWETPDNIFVPLNREFLFTLDPCATPENKKCSQYFTIEDNGLTKCWNKATVFMNPPYKDVGKWVKKAFYESRKGALVVCLIPARTNTAWWHDYCMSGEIRFVRGRPKFIGAKHGFPQPLAIVIFRPSNKPFNKDAQKDAHLLT